jgi:hypothetical protein
MSRERARPIAFAAIAVVVLTLVVWVLIDDGGESGAPAESASAENAELVEAGDLAARAEEVGHPIYWIGPRPGSALELAVEAGGNVFLRYLPEGTEAGDPGTQFLTVGTYPVGDARGAVENAASSSGAGLRELPGGGVAFLSPDGRRSAYLAFPGSSDQVEVYDPVAGRALQLALAGKVRPAD